MTESEPVYSPASGMVVIAARRANNSTRVLEQSCPAATFSSSSFPVSNMIGFDCASPDWLRDAAHTSFAHAEVEVNACYGLPGTDGVSWPGLHDGLGGVTWAWASSPVQRHPVVLRQRGALVSAFFRSGSATGTATACACRRSARAWRLTRAGARPASAMSASRWVPPGQAVRRPEFDVDGFDV